MCFRNKLSKFFLAGLKTFLKLSYLPGSLNWSICVKLVVELFKCGKVNNNLFILKKTQIRDTHIKFFDFKSGMKEKAKMPQM